MCARGSTLLSQLKLALLKHYIIDLALGFAFWALGTRTLPNHSGTRLALPSAQWIFPEHMVPLPVLDMWQSYSGRPSWTRATWLDTQACDTQHSSLGSLTRHAACEQQTWLETRADPLMFKIWEWPNWTWTRTQEAQIAKWSNSKSESISLI